MPRGRKVKTTTTKKNRRTGQTGPAARAVAQAAVPSPWLMTHQMVEVRQMEEGFEGSSYMARVLAPPQRGEVLVQVFSHAAGPRVCH